ncbi:MAG: hypothetical protein NTX50_30530 [Candidatus Sumerlaeota bacterium]|nr:hypothetical protein [Candidatus Sumerlaeota bacterium]
MIARRALGLCAVAAALGCTLPLAAQMNELPHVTSWVGNTWGAAGARYPELKNDMQMFVEAMAVAPDGTVFASSSWDEAHKEMGRYKDGQDLGQWQENSFGADWPKCQWSFNNADGGAVAAGDDYVFMTIDRTINSKEQGPGWFRRYDRKTNRPKGFDVKASAARVEGLAYNDGEVFISDCASNRIAVYDAESLEKKREFPCDKPGKLAVDSDGKLWVVKRGERAIARFERDGKDSGARIAFAPESRPTDLAWNAAKRQLMVADDGPDHDIKFYDLARLNGAPTAPAGTFGAKGGIFSGVRGQWQPAKFFDLTGVGCDREGNLYVSMSGTRSVQKNGAAIESYTPDGKLRWSAYNHGFIEVGLVDPAAETDVFTTTKHYVMDYSKGPGHEWSYRGQTLDAARYPDDSRRRMGESCAMAVKRIAGQRFLFFSDMYSRFLAVYRFNAATDGEIAVPCALFMKSRWNEKSTGAAAGGVDQDADVWVSQEGIKVRAAAAPWPPHQPAKGEWIWTDANGDGRMDDGEYEINKAADAPGDAWGWSIDQRGDVWLASAKQGVRRYAFQGLNANGAPRYDFAHATLTPMPAPFTLLRRAEYDAEKDVIILSGYTEAFPNTSNLWGKGIGRVVARYDGWSKGPGAETGAALGKPAWLIEDLLYSKGGMHKDRFITALDMAGDYVFMQTSHCDEKFRENTQTCYVYSKSDGKPVGQFRPGPEVQTGPAQIDIAWGMRAFRRSNGEYLIFVEDDWFGKSLMYRWDGKK